jgi:hypothetical protein
MVKEATPIFVSAVKKYNLHGCKTILLGNIGSYTYLQNSTTTALYAKFNPVIKIHLVK